jgi:cysteine desulfuration protein SufE
MHESHLKKVEKIIKNFSSLKTPDERYRALMDLGRKLPPFPPVHKTPENLVRGCQSDLYLHATLKDGKIFFECFSDALISSGLAAVLISVYSEEPPETLLQCPPTFLPDLGLLTSLSPGRSNGLAHIHLRMKQEAAKTLILK